MYSRYNPKRLGYFKNNDDTTVKKKSGSLIEFFVSILDSIAILDYNYKYLYVNETTANAAGLTSKELIGLNIWEKFPALIDTVFEKNVREAMDTREIRRFEWQGVYANMILEFTIAPLDEGVMISCENLSKKADETFSGKEDKYQYLIMHAPTGICEIDYAELKFRSVNDTICNILGYSRKELLSISILDVLNAEYKDRFQKRIKRGLAGEKLTDSTEYKLTAKNGRELWAVLDARLTYDDGKLDSVLIVLHDVTERKILQAKLEEYNKNLEKLVEERTKQLQNKERLATIGQTAGMVGHDIRNPLQSITGELYLVKSELTTLPDDNIRKNLQDSINIIEENLYYINKIISDLQDFTKQLTPHFEEVDMKPILDDILTNILPKNIELNVNVADELRKLKTDPTYLKRIIDNLVLNAIQAMPEGGKLTVRASKDKDAGSVLIVVEDTGVGIPEEIKPKLFTPLITTKAKGQGFGLPVVKRLTESLGGTISFESQEGKGTKFTVKLPQDTSKQPDSSATNQ